MKSDFNLLYTKWDSHATQQTLTLKKQWRTLPTFVGVNISLCVHLSVIHTPAVQSCTKQFPPRDSFVSRERCCHLNQHSCCLQSCSHFFFCDCGCTAFVWGTFLEGKRKKKNLKPHGVGQNKWAPRLSFAFPSICWKPLFWCEDPTQSATLSSPQLNVTYRDCLKHRMCLTAVTEHISAALENPASQVTWPCDALTWSHATATVTSLLCRAFLRSAPLSLSLM